MSILLLADTKYRKLISPTSARHGELPDSDLERDLFMLDLLDDEPTVVDVSRIRLKDYERVWKLYTNGLSTNDAPAFVDALVLVGGILVE